jgi:hypothetical protein
MQMTFDDALALAETLSPRAQMRAMVVYRQTSARFDDVRTAFINAIEQEVAQPIVSLPLPVRLMAPTLRVVPPVPSQPRRIDWAGVLALLCMSLSVLATGAGLFVITRTLGVC